MTSRQRLLTVLRGRQPDRVPVTIYEFSPCNDDWAGQEPSYAPLLALQREYGDSFVWAPVDCPIFLNDPNAIHDRQEPARGGTVIRTTELDTPRGKLRAVSRRDAEMMTNWQIEPLIKSDADIDKLLSMPDSQAAVNVERIRALEAAAGDAGLLCFSIGDAIGHVVGLFEFRDFVVRCLRDDGPVRALLEKAQRLVLRAITEIGAHVKDAAFRLWGPEYCGAPLMNPRRFFPRYVVEHDRAATEAIHATGNFSVIHCHGRLRDLLDMLGEIGADALEPIETVTVATGDVTLEEVKRRLGHRMCLMGGIQALTLETGTPEDVRQQVRECIAAAAVGGRFVLLPTAAPFKVPLAPAVLANIEAMFRAAREFGQYG